MNNTKKVLVIDDEARMRRILQLFLEQAGYSVKTAESGEAGIKLWLQWEPDVVLTDLRMPDKDGLEVLKFKNSHGLKAPLIILTAYGTIPSAVEAIKLGAFDYLTKPFDNNEVKQVIAKALRESARESGKGPNLCPCIIGRSNSIKKVLQDMALVANTDTSVLIIGESGTGKELVARGIHSMGNRSHKPFVKVNCAAIPAELMESELFGHKKGAFTGAVADRCGKFQEAHGGVLFLDEVGDLPLTLQPKLLNAVEEKIITPIGATSPVRCDVKIVSATNQDLDEMVRQGKFRKDLHYRLNTFVINLPPLRERKEDIPLLVEHYLEYYKNKLGIEEVRLHPDAMDVLMNYNWPGNVRELKNLMERLVLKSSGRDITVQDITDHISPCVAPSKAPTFESSGEMDLIAHEKQLILDALQKTGGNQVKAAKLLGITRNTLRYRMKKYGIKGTLHP